jgi:hypothetical protein
LFERAGLPWNPPDATAPYQKRRIFLNEEMPGFLRLLLEEGRVRAEFDALVVDEAQDIDTRFADDKPASKGLGWWAVLLAVVTWREG